MEESRKNYGAETAGYAAGNFGTVNKLFNEEKFHAAQGHGFAAERANDLYDKATGHITRIVGDDNAKNGADRWVNGTLLQTKYCATARGSINACFENGGSGRYRYLTHLGLPMKVEVPSDQYDQAVAVMREKIINGQVPGVRNPLRADNLVRKGHFSYDQAVHIAKAGNTDSLIYDASTGVLIGSAAGGISALITYLMTKAGGADCEEARSEAVRAGLRTGTRSAATAAAAGQLSKAGLNSALVGSSEAVATAIGPKASAAIVNAFRSGSNIYGAAAMKSCAKLIRGNAISGVVTVGLLSATDAVRLGTHRITGKQFARNLIGNSATVSAGAAGFVAGQALIPIPVVGGLIGSFVLGSVGGRIAEGISDIALGDAEKESYGLLEKEEVIYG